MSSTAYVDESEPDQSRDPGTYLLAAAIVSDGTADHARSTMHGMLLPGSSKVHWNKEHTRHEALAQAVAGTGCSHLVVVRAIDDGARSERRRRLCLERLLHELAQIEDVAQVVLEARQGKQNARDMALLNTVRAKRLDGGRLRMSHVAGPKEPLLWMPDVVVGAYGAGRQGLVGPVDILTPHLTIHVCN